MRGQGSGGSARGPWSDRAPRFEIHTPLRYRISGESQRRNGTTRNISGSGVAFRAEVLVKPRTQIEMNLVLPAEVSRAGKREVTCHGYIVRARLPSGKNQLPLLAAAISDLPQAAGDEGL